MRMMVDLAHLRLLEEQFPLRGAVARALAVLAAHAWARWHLTKAEVAALEFQRARRRGGRRVADVRLRRREAVALARYDAAMQSLADYTGHRDVGRPSPGSSRRWRRAP
jgi:hypothetical protein